jgi:hypothetical protein
MTNHLFQTENQNLHQSHDFDKMKIKQNDFNLQINSSLNSS